MISVAGRKDDIVKIMKYIERRGYENITKRERVIDSENDVNLVGAAYVLTQLKQITINTNKDLPL